MANFEPKKIDISSINGGQRYENGQGIDANAINAPIEAGLLLQQLATNQPILEENGGEVNVVIENAETNPQFKFQNLKRQQEFDRIANEQNEQDERIGNNEKNIQNIKAILTGNNQFVKVTSSQAYASRVTADGANIFDDQLTPVQEISGSTVKTTNLFDISAVVSKPAITTTDREITLTNIDNTSVGDMKSLFPNLTVGKTYTLVCTVEGDPAIDGGLNGTIYTDGEQIALLRVVRAGLNSAYFTLTQKMYDKSIRFYSLKNGTVTWKDLRCFEGQYTTADAPEWTPYFAGLKHVYINSIVSKNQDGTQESVFQLPETVELPEYDKILPQTGEIVRATGYATSETEFTDEEIATYNNAVVSNDRKSLVYELATATTTPINAPKVYTAWNGGTETIVQGETDNSQFGAMPTVTQTYFGKVGEE